MKKIESLFIGAGMLAVVAGMSGVLWQHCHRAHDSQTFIQPTNKYGAFLAAQHAIYVNDFDNAAKFSGALDETEFAIVQNTKIISDFLSGRMPTQASLLEKEKTAPARLIYDAYLVEQGNWDALYKRHKKDESALSAPLRIWSSVATKRTADALKFIDKLPTNASWKSFVRGQIYAETGDADKAAAEFAQVRPDFMNINDYLYIMSFYTHRGMDEQASTLREEFTSRPGGMFMLDYESVPDWSQYSGYKNALAFSLVQNVSHTQIMMYSDLAILLLRFAQLTGPDFGANNDAINYYIGQFFFNNVGDYEKHFSKIDRKSPFYLFALLRDTEKSNDIEPLQRALRAHPLFVPAVNKLIAYHIARGDKAAALRTVNRALDDDKLTDSGHAFFLKSRAQIHYAFGDYTDAQADIRAASEVLVVDAEILSLQAKIWAAQNREIENAYEYAMTLVKQNPTDIMAWDTLGCVVAAREGTDAALEVLERVGEISNTCSSLFEHLGDLYAAKGEKDMARDAYLRAIDLSDDGLVVVPAVQKKLRKLK